MAEITAGVEFAAERLRQRGFGPVLLEDLIENVQKVNAALFENDGASLAVYSLKYLDQAESVDLWKILEASSA